MSSDSVDEPPLKCSRGLKRSITNEKEIKEDRISSLPDCLLIHILSLLGNTKQAVRTCVLSKKWEYVWTHLLEIDLFEFTNDIAKKSKFVDFVSRMMAMCKNLHKLALIFKYDERFVSNINLLIDLAIKSKVKDINFHWGLSNYELPEMFYSNSSLTNLTLRGCVVAPRGIVSWGSLKNLSIGFDITNSSMEKVLLGCPVLEVLSLFNREGLDSLNISSPNLTTLEIHETSVCIKDVDVVLDISAPYLHVLSIINYNPGLKFRFKNVQSVVQASLEFVQMKEIPSFTKLQHLTLSGYSSIPAIRGMLGKSPNLETLHIKRSWTSPMQQIHEDLINFEDWNEESFPMKTVQITDFTEEDLTSAYMLFLIKMLLLCTPALKEMIITVKEDPRNNIYATSVDSSELTKTLRTFPKASGKAVVLLN